MTGELTVVGLGPAGLDRLPARVIDRLLDPSITLILRTLRHPAAVELAKLRSATSCDDLYESEPTFDEVYEAIVVRVLAAAELGPVVYAVPGSAVVGERAATAVSSAAVRTGLSVELIAGESFLDLVYAAARVDPIADGVQIVDGRDLPDPFPLHLPTVVTQVDRPVVLADVATTLGRVLPGDTEVVVLARLGGDDEEIIRVPLGDLHSVPAGPRTTLFLDPPSAGWHGLVTTNRRLRAECPWDREQTHHTLVSHLVEEAYETVEALSRLDADAPRGDPDFGAYAEVEEELGDLLLQVVFHATLAAEAGAFGVEEVAEGIRRKLVRRHPHVFGDVVAEEPEVVLANWEHLKSEEKQRSSLMDDVPAALPAMARADKMQRRAASAGFDWETVEPVFAKVHEELEELHAVADSSRAASELGDLLFAVVNLARHLGIDPELALRRSADEFAERFRGVERLAVRQGSDLAALSLEQMDGLWEEVKRRRRSEQ